MKSIRDVLNRPFGIGQPIWLLELGAAIIGTETELLLKSRNVYPEKLLRSGFKFQYVELDNCLDRIENRVGRLVGRRTKEGDFANKALRFAQGPFSLLEIGSSKLDRFPKAKKPSIFR